MEKAEAAVKQLSKQYERVSPLNRKKFAADKEIDMAESNLRQAKAQLEIARLNYGHLWLFCILTPNYWNIIL